MMKFILYSLFMGLGAGSWNGFQFSLFLAASLFGVLGLISFGEISAGWGLNCDAISGPLIMLSFWILGLSVSASQSNYNNKNYYQLFLFMNCVLMTVLLLTFTCKNYLTFYIFFESSLIPMVIMIIGWGYQPERLQAGMYMFFYTLFASLPLLVSLLTLYGKSGTLIIGEVSGLSNDNLVHQFWFGMSIIGFLVKLPVFMGHLWLPKAHVEAPVAGSMILAGVLLKLGGYGLLRILPIFMGSAIKLSWISVGLGVMGGFIVSLICLRQTDIKSLIAYSSVAHMGMVLAGIMTLVQWGLKGSVVVMVGHGLCSSGLFCLANVAYERMGSRSLLINKGLLNFMPSMALWWFLLTIGNMAAPPTLNMMGEIQLILSLVGWSKSCVIPLSLLLFFSVTYSLYMYSLSQHGRGISSHLACCSGKVREYLLMALHWFPLNILLIKSDMFM